MSDCFISYSSRDVEFAKGIQAELTRHDVSAFLAAISVEPGERWSTKIRTNLDLSNWVIFLASRAAVQSTWVQQELGMALHGGKTLIPVVWDLRPEELPGWVRDYQALDLAGKTPEQIRADFLKIAERIKAKKKQGMLVLASLVGAFLLFGGGNQ